MESLQEEQIKPKGKTLAERVIELEEKDKISRRDKETKARVKQFKWPFKWRWKFNKATKASSDLMLVIFLNKKNQIEPPKFMPIFDGNMIVWKNKPYEFDPRAIWTIKGMRKNPQAYLIKEIDRKPVRNKYGKIVYVDAAVSNMDLDEIRQRGDSTESDEFLIKAALKAQTAQINKKAFSIIGVIIIIAIIGGLAYYIFGGGG